MENPNIAYETEIQNEIINQLPGSPVTSGNLSETSESIVSLIHEGGESFYNYVDSLGLIGEPSLIVLSANHHYYFDNDDLKHTRTVINLKQLNQIKNIDLLFRSIFKIIPSGSNFIGCFLDNKTQYEFETKNTLKNYRTKNNIDPYENGIESRIPFLSTVYNILDLRTNRYLTKSNVSSLLMKQGFKVLDMTKLNGLTYFQARKV